jgi:hypothetical protein
MSFFPNGALAIGGAAAIAGLALFLLMPAIETSLPPKPAETANSPAVETPFPDIASLSAPWYVPAPARVGRAATPVPSAAPAAHPDSASLVFVGSYSQKDGSIAYFFKDRRNSQVLILKTGQPFKGWTLDDIGPKTFVLTGPGGQYEVAH